MRLLKLQCRNFKGLHNFTFEPAGNSVSVFGANGSGKTTIADAVSWLLFGKDSRSQAAFEIKPHGSNNVEVEVEGSFLNGDISVIIKKIYKEKYTKKRGSLHLEFTGHETEHFIDDVPVSQSAFKAKVGEISTTEEIFRLLTSPVYFNEQMHWNKRRELLFDISGNITDEQVAAANPELVELPGIFNGKPADDYKKIVMASRKKINEAIEGIPARIDEQTRSKPEITINNPQAIITKLTKLRAELAAKNDEIAQVNTGGGVAELQTKIAVIDGEIQAITNEHRSGLNAKVQGLKDDLSANKDRIAELKRNLQSFTARKGVDEHELRHQTETKAALLAEYGRLKSEVFTVGLCPTCQQDMPENLTEAARCLFNENKAKATELNISKGKACGAKIIELTASIALEEKNIKETSVDIEAAEIASGDIVIKIANIEKEAGNVSPTPAMIDAQRRRAEAVSQIEKIQSGSTEATDKLTAEKTAIETAIAEQEKHLSKIEQVQQADTRIADLKAEEKKLASEFATLEKHLFLIESFIRAKVSSLEESINSKFNIIKWKLFREQVNGGLEEICESTVGGVGYNSINHAARVNAGLECVQVFGDYYNFHPVIFVDGRESVTELPDMTAQVISLVVSADDKTLRIAAQKPIKIQRKNNE